MDGTRVQRLVMNQAHGESQRGQITSKLHKMRAELGDLQMWLEQKNDLKLYMAGVGAKCS